MTEAEKTETDQTDAGTTDAPVAVTPTDTKHLKELVDAALEPVLGKKPERAEDGTIPIPFGSALVVLAESATEPEVELVSPMVMGVTDQMAAAREVAILNRDSRYIRYVIDGDNVVARHRVRAMPFVADHLTYALQVMAKSVDGLDDDLAARVGGRRAADPRPAAADANQPRPVDDRPMPGLYL